MDVPPASGKYICNRTGATEWQCPSVTWPHGGNFRAGVGWDGYRGLGLRKAEDVVPWNHFQDGSFIGTCPTKNDSEGRFSSDINLALSGPGNWQPHSPPFKCHP